MWFGMSNVCWDNSCGLAWPMYVGITHVVWNTESRAGDESETGSQSETIVCWPNPTYTGRNNLEESQSASGHQKIAKTSIKKPLL